MPRGSDFLPVRHSESLLKLKWKCWPLTLLSFDGAEALDTRSWLLPSQMASEDQRPTDSTCFTPCSHAELLGVLWRALIRRQDT